jgi:hypothetical protein
MTSKQQEIASGSGFLAFAALIYIGSFSIKKPCLVR